MASTSYPNCQIFPTLILSRIQTRTSTTLASEECLNPSCQKVPMDFVARLRRNKSWLLSHGVSNGMPTHYTSYTSCLFLFFVFCLFAEYSKASRISGSYDPWTRSAPSVSFAPELRSGLPQARRARPAEVSRKTWQRGTASHLIRAFQ